MLIGNYSVLSKHPGRDRGGGAIGLGLNRSDFNKPSPSRNMFFSLTWSPKSGIPDGYRPPGSWVIPQKAGGIGARGSIEGTGTLALAMAGGRNGVATIAGTSTFTGDLSLIVQLVAAITGTGTVTGNAAAVASLQASLAGTSVVSALIGAIAGVQAAIAGTSTFTAAQSALAFMEAEIEACSGVLTVDDIVSGVWGAIATGVDVPGTTGGLLNDAGAGGNPWATVLEDNGVDTLTVLQGMRLILASATGPLSGAAGTTVTIRDALDHIDRIIAQVDASGNRLSVNLDVSD